MGSRRKFRPAAAADQMVDRVEVAGHTASRLGLRAVDTAVATSGPCINGTRGTGDAGAATGEDMAMVGRG